MTNDLSNTSAEFTVFLNGTIANASWNNVNVENSAAEYDTSGTVTGGSTIFIYNIPKSSTSSNRIDLGTIELEPGDILTISSNNTTDQGASIIWTSVE